MSTGAIRDVTIRLHLEAGNIPNIELPVRQEVEQTLGAMQAGIRTVGQEATEAARALEWMMNGGAGPGGGGGAAGGAQAVATIYDLQNALGEFQATVKEFGRNRASVDEVTAAYERFGAVVRAIESSPESQLPGDMAEVERAVQAALRELVKIEQIDYTRTTREATKELANEINVAKDRLREMAQQGHEVGAIKAKIDPLVQAFASLSQEAGIPLSPADLERLRMEFTKLADEGVAKFNREIVASERAAQAMEKRQQRAWMGLTQSITAAATGATQVIALMQTLGIGSKDNLEDIAKSFIRIQATVQGMQAGQQTLMSITKGLGDLQQLLNVAATRSVALAGANTTAAASYRMLAGAATVAQAAMGPISVALTAAGLAYTAIQTYSELFGSSASNAAERARKEQERLNAELDETLRKLDGNTQAMELQLKLIRQRQGIESEGSGDSAELLREQMLEQREAQDRINREKMSRARAILIADLRTQAAMRRGPGEFRGDFEQGLHELSQATGVADIFGGAPQTGKRRLNDRIGLQEGISKISGAQSLAELLDASKSATTDAGREASKILSEINSDEIGIMTGAQQRSQSAIDDRNRREREIQRSMQDAKALLDQELEMERRSRELSPSVSRQIDRLMGKFDAEGNVTSRGKIADELSGILSQQGLISRDDQKSFRGSDTDMNAIRAILEDNSSAEEEKQQLEAEIQRAEQDLEEVRMQRKALEELRDSTLQQKRATTQVINDLVRAQRVE